MFTRKDYVEIAEEIRVSTHMTRLINYSDPAETVAHVARGIADALKRNNPRFRYDTFFEACGLDEYGNVPRKAES